MDRWLRNRSHCPLQQLTRRRKWLRVREDRGERKDYLQFIHHNSATLSEKASALIFLSAGEEGCAEFQLKSIGQQYSQSCGGVKDGMTDQRTGLYRLMQMKNCVLVCTGQSTGVTLFVAGLQSGLLCRCFNLTGRRSFFLTIWSSFA